MVGFIEMEIAIIDYGLGNIFSVTSALTHLGHKVVVDTDGTVLTKSDICILPGVAEFGSGINNMKLSGQFDALSDKYISGNPIIGLCLGAQMFLNSSEEAPGVNGFGFVEGVSKAFIKDKKFLTFQGWSKVFFKENTLNQSLGRKDYYFSHSYYTYVDKEEFRMGESQHYGVDITSCFIKGNILGAQFHPERSGRLGLDFLQYSIDWARNIG